MTSKTPKTDAAQQKCTAAFCVDSDFARELELENIAMRNAMIVVAELIDGTDLNLKGNHGMFILAAQDKLQPFLK